MAKLYTMVGQLFRKMGTLNHLNDDLKEFGLVADPHECETCFKDQYRIGNVRRIDDLSGTVRYDHVQFSPTDDFSDYVCIGKIIGESLIKRGKAWPLIVDKEKENQSLKEVASDFKNPITYTFISNYS